MPPSRRSEKDKDKEVNPDGSKATDSQTSNDSGKGTCICYEELSTIRQTLDSLSKLADIESMVQVAVTTIMNTLSEQLKLEISHLIKQEMEKFDAKLNELAKDKDKLQAEVNNQKLNMKEMNDRLETCIKNTNIATQMANRNEQYSRKRNVKLLGIPEEKDETVLDKVIDLFKGLGEDIDPNDVQAIHRLPSQDKSQPRPVLVKFFYSDNKLRVI
ncbi:uncharacterized protein LOC121382903 [Gigantopelta aegis]|uniref:uncharacterized protein LOC121382903 n=1 Tax=Gigantopelta aegis TaxID=1735272 RepID=UPI001B88B73B|nr:uncharacterized protein LOC121382903 [Gigantopelta aegis]